MPPTLALPPPTTQVPSGQVGPRDATQAPSGPVGPKDGRGDAITQDLSLTMAVHVPSGSVGPSGGTSSHAAAAAQADVKVRVQTNPILERHIERLEAQHAQDEKRIADLQLALDAKMHESVQNFQAALASNDANVLIGMEGGRRIYEYKEAGAELQRQLQGARQEVTEASWALAARGQHAHELTAEFATSRNSESEMLAHAQSHVATLHQQYQQHADAVAARWGEEFGALSRAHTDMCQQAQDAMEAGALAEQSASTLRAESRWSQSRS